MMYKRQHLAMCMIAVAFLIHSVRGQAQPNCKVEIFSTEHGLPHDAINHIVKDKEGFLWLATWNGISRYDGEEFVSYRSLPGDNSELKNSRINYMVEDKNNRFWLLAADDQVYRFDKVTERFLNVSRLINARVKKDLRFQTIEILKDGSVWLISENDGIFCLRNPESTKMKFSWYDTGQVNFVHQDQKGSVWIGTDKGLDCVSKSSGGLFTFRVVNKALASGRGYMVCKEDKGYLYFGTSRGELVVYDKSKGWSSDVRERYQVLELSSGNSINALCISAQRSLVYATTSGGELVSVPRGGVAPVRKKTFNQPIHRLYEDRHGKLWIEPAEQGVIMYDPSNGTQRHFTQKADRDFKVYTRYFQVYEDRAGLVWVKMKRGGFGYYDSETKQIEYFYNEPNTSTRMFSNMVSYLHYDRDGVLWFTTDERGLNKVIFQADNFRQTLLRPGESLKSENDVRGILEDREGRLWLGAKSAELYVFGKQGRLKDLFVNMPVGGLGMVYTIIEDRRGHIWLGTKANGLFIASPVNKERTKYTLQHFHVKNGLGSNEIYSLLEDADGSVLIGTIDAGLCVAQWKNGSVSIVPGDQVFGKYPTELFKKNRHLSLDSQGNIWVGTTNGLLILDGKKRGRWKSYSKVKNDSTSLGINDIQYIFRDRAGRMWLGTSGGGLNLAIGDKVFESLKFRSYTTAQGLSNDYVLSCTEDEGGHLWVATQGGLSRFDPSRGYFRKFDSYDGLSQVSFSEASCIRHSNGSIIYGTSKGYISFFPAKLRDSEENRRIVLTKLQVNNEDVAAGDGHQLLRSNINYTTDLTLRYDQNTVSVDYASLDYRSNAKQQYVYRLRDFDKTWQKNSNRRRISYTNLPPGEYALEIKHAEQDTGKADQFRLLHIHILPPPWRTYWAYLLYVVLFAAIFEGVRRTVITVIRLRHKIAVEQELAALKMNFFTNISHELRTPLTLILNPIEELAQREDLSKQGRSYVEIVRKNANRMVRFINQLLDLRKVQSGKASLKITSVDLVALLRNVTYYFEETARQNNIELQLDSSRDVMLVQADEEKLDIVIYNLLSNAFKFSPPGKKIRVEVSDSENEGNFVVRIHDQGSGVPVNKLQKIFELYYQDEAKDGLQLKGTGIGLALSRELVDLQGGKIFASVNGDGGLSVTVELKASDVELSGSALSAEHILTDLFDESVKGRPLAGFGRAAITEQPSVPLKVGDRPLVLLVEDNDDLRAFLREQLSDTYRVETAVNGEEGLSKAVILQPDLILSDVMMPLMDGIEMLQKLREDQRTSHIPLILLTAKSSIESQIQALDFGADYYITKPFSNAFLRASVQNLIRSRKELFKKLLENPGDVTLRPSEVVITSRDELFLKEVIQIVETGMIDPGFNIDELAEKIGMGRTTFYKKFKSLTNMTPVEFVRDMRVQRGKQMLDAGEINIASVAYSVGFNDPKYFGTCFREKYGMPPSGYLRSLR
ncbi:two-component regulator propeller domain-containing protein [Arcticibacter sp.]|uniref:hybrid sensor histidine kinase/response regulator transcription factor n=1 Tax=Arcticibacter sp. TaxID=1872630 RepID=UPI00388F16DA